MWVRVGFGVAVGVGTFVVSVFIIICVYSVCCRVKRRCSQDSRHIAKRVVATSTFANTQLHSPQPIFAQDRTRQFSADVMQWGYDFDTKSKFSDPYELNQDFYLSTPPLPTARLPIPDVDVGNIAPSTIPVSAASSFSTSLHSGLLSVEIQNP